MKICPEVLVLVTLCLLLVAYLGTKLYQHKNGFSTIEKFADVSLTDLVNDFENLSAEDKVDVKNKISRILGSPMSHEDMIPKSAIPPQRECPSLKDELDLVKRSSVLATTKPVPCVCPKVEIDAELCKGQKCPPCPKCEECSKVVTVHKPVFITKTITVTKDGEVLDEKLEKANESEVNIPSTIDTDDTPITTNTKALEDASSTGATATTKVSATTTTSVTEECKGVECALNKMNKWLDNTFF